MHSSKAIQALMDGSYYDRVQAYLRYDKKAPLNENDKIIFERIERTKDLWLHHKDDRMVVQVIMQEFDISQAQAYNYLNDAKSIFALFTSYNEMTELLLVKERIEKGFKLAEENPKVFGKLYGICLEEHRKWVWCMNQAMERNKPESEKEIIFIYDTDALQIPGMDARKLQEWNNEFDELEMKSKQKFKFVEEANDVEYSENS